jgi:hypothetical protein
MDRVLLVDRKGFTKMVTLEKRARSYKVMDTSRAVGPMTWGELTITEITLYDTGWFKEDRDGTYRIFKEE